MSGRQIFQVMQYIFAPETDCFSNHISKNAEYNFCLVNFFLVFKINNYLINDVVYLMSSNAEKMGINDGQKLPSNFASFVGHFMRRYWCGFSISFLVCALSYVSLGFIGPALLKKLINDLTLGQVDFLLDFLLIIGFAVCSVLWALCDSISKRSEFGCTCKMRQDINNSVFQYTLQHTQQYFSDNFAGNLSSKINDISRGATDMIHKTMDIICSYLCFIVLSVLLMQTHVGLGVGLLAWAVIYTWSAMKLSDILGKKMTTVAGLESEVSGHMVDCFANVANVKNYVQENYEKGNLHVKSLAILRAESSFRWWETALLLHTFVSMSSVIVLTLGVPFYLVTQQRMDVGDLIFIISAIGNMVWWIKYAMDLLRQNFSSYGRAKQALETILVPHTIHNLAEAKLGRNYLLKSGSIELKQVNFYYGKDQSQVFKNLNLSIADGSKVGIVGYSGAGKSTLINLLLRCYDINSGEILLGGHNIRTELTQEALRNNISYIPQEPILFHRTIRENIVYGKPHATEAEILQASRQALCDEFIQQLPQKYDTMVGERGTKLSGGQRQRIAIARAILKNAPVLILDEATSALDSLTEHLVQEALTHLMENKTVIAIAHRLSTLDIMDRIIVLDKGRIVEDGTREELLANPQGLFSQLWQMQKDGFVPE